MVGLAALGVIATAFSFDADSRAAILDYQADKTFHGKTWKKTTESAVMNAASKYGDWPYLALYGGIALLVAWRLKNQRWTELIAAALIASTVAGLLSNVSRQTAGRVRPREVPKIEAGWYGPYHNGQILVGRPAYNSFPSSHAAASAGFAAPILFASPAVGVILMAGALLISWSRMMLGAHYLSDVTVGMLLGLWVGWFVLRWVQLRGKQSADVIWRKIRQQLKLKP